MLRTKPKVNTDDKIEQRATGRGDGKKQEGRKYLMNIDEQIIDDINEIIIRKERNAKSSYSISPQTHFTIKPNPRMIYFRLRLASSLPLTLTHHSDKEAAQGHAKWNKLWETRNDSI